MLRDIDNIRIRVIIGGSMMKKLFSKFLCFIFGHKCVKLNKDRSYLAAGAKCIREGCNYIRDEVYWPAPPTEPIRYNPHKCEHPCNRDKHQ